MHSAYSFKHRVFRTWKLYFSTKKHEQMELRMKENLEINFSKILLSQMGNVEAETHSAIFPILHGQFLAEVC